MSRHVQATSLATFEQDVLGCLTPAAGHRRFLGQLVWAVPDAGAHSRQGGEGTGRPGPGGQGGYRRGAGAGQASSRSGASRPSCCSGDGKLASQFVGVQPEHAIRDWIDALPAGARSAAPRSPAEESPEDLAGAGAVCGRCGQRPASTWTNFRRTAGRRTGCAACVRGCTLPMNSSRSRRHGRP